MVGTPAHPQGPHFCIAVESLCGTLAVHRGAPFKERVFERV